MRIELQTSGVELTSDVREHVERRFGFALAPAHMRNGRARVRLSDENGPRGGNDKRCRVQIAIEGMTEIVIDDTQADIKVAIDRAADRLGSTLSRRLMRLRQRTATPVRRMAGLEMSAPA